MPPGLDYALGAMLFFGLGDLVYKRGASAGALPHHFLMVQSWLFLPLVTTYAALTGTLQFSIGALWGGLAGVFVLAGFYNFAYSLRSGAVSINAPVFRLSFVITAALAIGLLGEPLTFPKAGGIALALAAAWLLLGGPVPGGSTREMRASLVRVLVATACVGVGNFLYSLALRAGVPPATVVVAQAAVVVPLAILLTLALERRVRPSGAALRNAPLASMALAIAFVCMAEGMLRAQASIVVPIAQMGFVVTAMLGFVFLRERFTLRKGAGIVAAVAALGCLAIA